MKCVFAVIVACAALGLPGWAQAALATEQINNFDSNISITRENVADIIETIKYDFGNEDRHGIYRYIPLDYTDDKSQSYHLAANLVNVVDGAGRTIPVDTSKSNGNYVMKIGDPNKTVTGIQTYKIHFKLWPMVREEGGRGLLALNITGNGWNVPIRNVTAKIALDDGTALADSRCFQGPTGSKQECRGGGGTSLFSASDLVANEGMTVQGFVPAGYVSEYLVAGKLAPLTSDDIIAFVMTGLAVTAFLGVAFILFLRWRRMRRRKAAQTVIAQYEAPDGLAPPEIGLLQDDVSSMREITAMLIDLAVRGYIKIEQTSPKKWYRKAKYTLHKLKEPSGFQPAETILWQPIFNGRDQVALDDLSKTEMAAAIAKIHRELKDGLKKKGFYGSFSSEPGVIEKLLDAGTITDVGAAQWAEVEGLKLYLNVAEKDRLNFSDAPNRTPERFNKLLPYAVALGVEKQWAKQFEGINMQQSATWYSGSVHGFSAFALANDMGGSFNSTFASNATVSSSSGGGSSGGGFSGGGGGSW